VEMASTSRFTPLRPRAETCYDSRMARFRKLRDAYRFPGFVPGEAVQGVFGDRMAVVVSLTRRQKKPLVARVVDGIGATTTRGGVAYAISLVATGGSTWSLRLAAWSAGAAAQ
jgi:hypothetical protein